MKRKPSSEERIAARLAEEIVCDLDPHMVPGGTRHGEDYVTRSSLMEVLRKWLPEKHADPKRETPTRYPKRAPLVLTLEECRVLDQLVCNRLEVYQIGPRERRNRIERLARLRQKIWEI